MFLANEISVRPDQLIAKDTKERKESGRRMRELASHNTHLSSSHKDLEGKSGKFFKRSKYRSIGKREIDWT